MDTRPCSFCSHENPEDAKFCNACGSSMHLQLCQRCGAIDNVSAFACYKCGASFSNHATDDGSWPEAESVTGPADTASSDASDVRTAGIAGASPRADDTGPLRRTGKRKGAASALLFVAIAAVATLLYRTYAPSDEGGAGEAARASTASRSSGTIDATLGAVPPSSAILAAEVVPVRAQPQEPAAVQPIATDDRPLPVNANEPTPAAEATGAGIGGSRAPPGDYPCTPEVAALGLCN